MALESLGERSSPRILVRVSLATNLPTRSTPSTPTRVTQIGRSRARSQTAHLGAAQWNRPQISRRRYARHGRHCSACCNNAAGDAEPAARISRDPFRGKHQARGRDGSRDSVRVHGPNPGNVLSAASTPFHDRSNCTSLFQHGTRQMANRLDALPRHAHVREIGRAIA